MSERIEVLSGGFGLLYDATGGKYNGSLSYVFITGISCGGFLIGRFLVAFFTGAFTLTTTF